MDDKSFSWVLLLVILFFGVFSSWDKVWVENYYCKGGWIDDNCSGKELRLSTTKYEVNKDKQLAIQNVNDTGPLTFTNCSIENSNNWKCFYNDDLTTFGLTNGKYEETNLLANNFTEMKGVAHTTWIMHMLDVIKNIFSDGDSSNAPTNSDNSLQTTLNTYSNDPFPMNDGNSQYAWYDQHNVAMAYRCYPSTLCSEEEWAFAVYGNKNDSRGSDLKQQADTVYASNKLQFPSEKCVNEGNVKICDISFNVVTTHPAGTRTVKMDGNKIGCINTLSGAKTTADSNVIIVDAGNTFCATDGGDIYIDSTLDVSKYFGMIKKTDSYANYALPISYNSCIWTYNGGSGNIPYLDITGSDGPDTGYFNIKAFCKDGNNRVGIYSYNSNS
ncbi:MAG: hypothetical protein M3Q24_01405 [bacterium]|nr:hypothetical protein [bacterium]